MMDRMNRMDRMDRICAGMHHLDFWILGLVVAGVGQEA